MLSVSLVSARPVLQLPTVKRQAKSSAKVNALFTLSRKQDLAFDAPTVACWRIILLLRSRAVPNCDSDCRNDGKRKAVARAEALCYGRSPTCRGMCGHGGIGRRATLRSLWAKARGSSSLLGRTKNCYYSTIYDRVWHSLAHEVCYGLCRMCGRVKVALFI